MYNTQQQDSPHLSTMCPRGDIFYLQENSMSNVKDPSTYEQQIALIKSRGCIVEDDKTCLDALNRIGYYRLSAYFLPFKKADNSYKSGLKFSTVYSIYEFDRELRGIILTALEEIEIYLRSQISYYHTRKYGPLGYTNPSNYNARHEHDKFKNTYEREIKNHSNVAFVKHHNRNYNGDFPLWVLMELFSFGMISKFYDDLPTQDRKSIAKEIGINYKQLSSWLRCCTDLRNICAHYGRLYFRIFPAIPLGIQTDDYSKRRLWSVVLVIKKLFPSKEKWNTILIPRLERIINNHSEDIDLRLIAFPEDWKDKLAR